MEEGILDAHEKTLVKHGTTCLELELIKNSQRTINTYYRLAIYNLPQGNLIVGQLK
jgi:hypothetical protein